jgi:hypothetical protein
MPMNVIEASKTMMRKPTHRHDGEGRRYGVSKCGNVPTNDTDPMVSAGV